MSQSYGQNLAGDVRYEGREWHDFESEARADYERDNQGGQTLGRGQRQCALELEKNKEARALSRVAQ